LLDGGARGVRAPRVQASLLVLPVGAPAAPTREGVSPVIADVGGGPRPWAMPACWIPAGAGMTIGSSVGVGVQRGVRPSAAYEVLFFELFAGEFDGLTSGTVAAIVVPPSLETIVTSPPSCRMRSRMPRRPTPMLASPWSNASRALGAIPWP